MFEQMMGKGGRKQKWSSNKIAAEKAAKIDKKRGEIGRKRNYRMENRKQKRCFLGNSERNKVGVKLLKEEDRQVIRS